LREKSGRLIGGGAVFLLVLCCLVIYLLWRASLPEVHGLPEDTPTADLLAQAHKTDSTPPTKLALLSETALPSRTQTLPVVVRVSTVTPAGERSALMPAGERPALTPRATLRAVTSTPNLNNLPFVQFAPTFTPEPTRLPPGRLAVTPVDPARAASLQALHRSGQTFLTWEELPGQGNIYRGNLYRGNLYRVYRSQTPFDGRDFSHALLLAETGDNSSRFYANRRDRGEDDRGDGAGWDWRVSEGLVIESGAKALSPGTGLLVWTLSPDDLGGKSEGVGYYAVTQRVNDGERLLALSDPLQESVAPPEPVNITSLPGVDPDEGEHVFIQYMDLRNWNPTFHAPNPTNRYYGLDPQDPSLAHALQYAYDYTVFEPSPEMCGGQVPASLPVVVFLHGWRGNRYGAIVRNEYPLCAYLIYPIDQSETWYFGFAEQHDYRTGGQTGGAVQPGDSIVNYTEQRVLRMVADLLRDPPGDPAADPLRVYVFGHSMGGSGALALAMRYPNVFAAAYASQPITDYLTAGVTHQDWAADAAVKWGAPELNLPVKLRAPQDWAAHLQVYNGRGVWDWQRPLSLLAEGVETVPLGIDHGIPDHVIVWSTQGLPVYGEMDEGRAAWGGAVTGDGHAISHFAGLPPGLGLLDGVPFWGLSVVRDETLAGFSHISADPPLPPQEVGFYHQTLMGSSSWNNWDGAPLDTAQEWQISLCAVAVGSQECGTGILQTAHVTVRRAQQFRPAPGDLLDYEIRRVKDDHLESFGTLQVDGFGLVTVKNVVIGPEGVRLRIWRR